MGQGKWRKGWRGGKRARTPQMGSQKGGTEESTFGGVTARNKLCLVLVKTS